MPKLLLDGDTDLRELFWDRNAGGIDALVEMTVAGDGYGLVILVEAAGVERIYIDVMRCCLLS